MTRQSVHTEEQQSMTHNTMQESNVGENVVYKKKM